MSGEEYGGVPRLSIVRRLQAQGRRLTGDQVAAIIDDEDITYRACRCGDMGFSHDLSGGACWQCPCRAFVQREEG